MASFLTPTLWLCCALFTIFIHLFDFFAHKFGIEMLQFAYRYMALVIRNTCFFYIHLV